MSDPIQIVYWSEEFENLMIFTPASFFMFATVEGSNGRKLCTPEKDFKRVFKLTYIGEL